MPTHSPAHMPPLVTQKHREILSTLRDLSEQYPESLLALYYVVRTQERRRLVPADQGVLERFGLIDAEGAVAQDVASVIRLCVKVRGNDIVVRSHF